MPTQGHKRVNRPEFIQSLCDDKPVHELTWKDYQLDDLERIMFKKILTGVVITLGVATAATASTAATERGFQKCEAKLNTEFRGAGLVIDRAYLVKKAAESTTYYINGNVWSANGEREDLRTSCVTDLRGKSVTALGTDSGRFVPRSSVAIR
jgi:hypothetical protein